MTIDESYLHLLRCIKSFGYNLPPAERQGVGTRQLTAYQIQCDLREGFPLLTTKEMFHEGIFVELEWFMKGLTNIKWLRDRGCNIWNDDSYKYFLRLMKYQDPGVPLTKEEFLEYVDAGHRSGVLEHPDESAYTYGDMGPIYGAMWRAYPYVEVFDEQEGTIQYSTVDQLQRMVDRIKKAIEANYNDRRLIVDAWHPALSESAALPPCHKDFQVLLEPIPLEERLKIYDRIPRELKKSISQYVTEDDEVAEKLSEMNIPCYYLNLIWSQRSVDTFLGLPFNIASYAALAEILAQLTGTIAKDLVGQLRAVHIYDNHWEAVETQLSREPKQLPQLHVFSGLANIDEFQSDHLTVQNYEYHPRIKAQMNS